MSFRLALAISFSVLLIGVASWYRFTPTQNNQPNIIAIEEIGKNNDDYESLLEQLNTPEPDTTSTTTEAKPLTGVGLIGRGLILDYVDLAASGAATEANITDLADRYVTSIPTLISSPKVNYSDIKTVSSTKSNFKNYSAEISKVHEQFTARMNEAYATAGGSTASTKSSYSFALAFSRAYTEAGYKLRYMSVPTSLLEKHTDLVSSYLSSGVAMEAVSNAEEDAATAFAGLVTANKNLKVENVLRYEIAKIISLNI